VPIVTSEQFQQQLIQVVAIHELVRRHHRKGAIEFRCRQLACFATPGPRDENAVKRLQHRGQRCRPAARAACASCEYGNAAVIAREELENPTRVSIRPMMQDIGRL
jgi:hypothetical protein